MTREYENRLREAGVAATPVRILVLRCLDRSQCPLSLSEIEAMLDTVDKSTVSRTLSTFREHHLVHAFNDGSGSMKYEVCGSLSMDGHHEDMHVHFRCSRCGTTICLTSISIPEVTLPEGFVISDTSYVISGLCASCNHRIN